MPFVVLKRFENGVEIDLSLYNYYFKENPEGFEFEFFNEERKVYLNIKEEENKVYFSFDNSFTDEYKEMIITLWKENEEKIIGLPEFKNKKKKRCKLLEKCKFLNKCLKNCKCKCIRKHFENNSIDPERKLNFYLTNKYFFENINLIDNYKLEVRDKIYLSTENKTADFKLRFSPDIESLLNTSEKNSFRIKKYPENSYFLRVKKIDEDQIRKFIKDNPDKPLKGIILEDKEYNVADIMVNLMTVNKILGLDLIMLINSEICLYQIKKYFDYQNLKVESGKLKVDLNKETAIRNYLLCIRKFLDLGVNGIYIDDNFTSYEMALLYTNVKIMIDEYFMTAVFHTHLSENSDDFGYYIIKDEKIIKNINKIYKNYLYSGELFLGKEEKISKNNKYFPVNIIKL